MGTFLVLALIVIILAAMWTGGILVDRHLRRKWDRVLEAHWAEWHAHTVEEDPLTPEREDELT